MILKNYYLHISNLNDLLELEIIISMLPKLSPNLPKKDKKNKACIKLNHRHSHFNLTPNNPSVYTKYQAEMSRSSIARKMIQDLILQNKSSTKKKIREEGSGKILTDKDHLSNRPKNKRCPKL